MIVLASFGLVLAGWVLGVLPLTALLFLAGLPLALYALAILFQHYGDRALVRANTATIALQAVAGLLLVVGLFL